MITQMLFRNKVVKTGEVDTVRKLSKNSSTKFNRKYQYTLKILYIF